MPNFIVIRKVSFPTYRGFMESRFVIHKCGTQEEVDAVLNSRQLSEFAVDEFTVTRPVGPAGWIGYGKSFYQLRQELSQKGESIIGVQVDIMQSEEYPSLGEGGLHLVGHVEAGSVISGGEHFEEIDNVFVLRYRRLLSAEQLEENS